MRLHYYRFPESVDNKTRSEHGCDEIKGCELNKNINLQEINYQCDKGYCYNCPHILVKDVDDTLSGISITHAKQLLKEYGGSAWTSHIDRDGGIFETTEIKIKGNNSSHKYNKHL